MAIWYVENIVADGRCNVETVNRPNYIQYLIKAFATANKRTMLVYVADVSCCVRTAGYSSVRTRENKNLF